MNLKQTIEMDFAVHGIPPRVYGKQDDSGSRAVEIDLYDQGVAWDVPEGALLQMRYRTAAGSIGVYDTMPDSSAAFAVSGNTITAQLVPQIFVLPGIVHCEVRIVSGATGISTWAFLVEVQEGNVGDAVLPSDYINVLNTLAAQVTADADRAEAAANSIDTSMLMSKAAYDPNGLVAAAGGIPAYVPKLSSSIDSSSTTTAANSYAVKKAYDRAGNLRGIANGIAPLDSAGKIPEAHMDFRSGSGSIRVTSGSLTSSNAFYFVRNGICFACVIANGTNMSAAVYISGFPAPIRPLGYTYISVGSVDVGLNSHLLRTISYSNGEINAASATSIQADSFSIRFIYLCE